ncbi:MAG: Gldg family protein, partial [Planctomycetes bacterium]|nr:Gldg family protein [Planctomycetota bacterium]
MASLAEILKLFLIDLAVIGVVLLALLPLAKYKKATFAVLKRNFVGYFSNPTGYVFLCLFVLLTTGFAFLSHEFFNANMANLDQLNKYLPYILLVFIPAITMSIWSEEKREGTDELLLTIPAGDVDIVLGKYLAAGAIFSASLVYSQLFNFGWLSLLSEGGVDLGLFCATSFGYWLIGMAMLSIAMAASFLTGNLTVAFILGAAFNAPLAVAGLADLLPSATALSGNVGKASMSANFADFGRGVISLPPLVYFVFVTAVGIYLSIVFIGRRHWLDGGRDVAESDGSARPMGRGVLAIALLNLAFGCMLSLLAVVVARDTVDVWQDSPELVPVLIGVLALLFYAGGIGLLLRAEWGKAINYVLAALTIAIIISLFLAMGEQIDQSNWGILIAMMISIIVLIAFCVLVFMYMQSLLLHYLVRTTCIFTVGIAMSFLATDYLGFVRFDLTDNQTNSLSDRTYELLDDLKLDRTVYVNAYISKDLPEKFVQIKYDLVSMLREIHEKSNKIVVTIDQSMEPLTKEAAQLRDQYGVEARMVPGVSTTGQFTTQPIFLAAVIECGLEKIVVPFFNDAGSIEYELMRSICTV